MIDEYLDLLRNNTWNLVPHPTDRKLIGYKWVFKVKENPNGTINKYKASLVAKGFHQIVGFDFNETFSLVVKSTTILIVLTITLNLQWKVRQLDVNNAFLNDLGDIDYFLVIQVKHTSAGMHLSQTKYISNLLQKTKMLHVKPVPTPMVSNYNTQLYRSTIGVLQYATITRSDITYSVNRVCQFMQAPLIANWKAVKRILRYLDGTLHHGLQLTPQLNRVL
ncbi:hypothetical protein AAG906_026683 [Vitis piasezkii]